MTGDVSQARLDEIIAALVAKATGAGAVTYEQVDEVLDESEFDIDLLERVCRALASLGIDLYDPAAGPPDFPPGYDGLRVVEGGRE